MKKLREDRRIALTAVIHEGKYMLGIVEEGLAGYTPASKEGTFDSYEEAKTKAKERNELLGLTEKEALEIVLTSMGRPPRKP